MVSKAVQPRGREEFEIAIICALRLEADVVEALFDEYWDEDGDRYRKAPGDRNAYTTGAIGYHNVVLAHIPGIGRGSAASAASSLRSSFTGIKLALIVGICGGAPIGTNSEEILLGDIIISTGIIQYDFGRQLPDRYIRKDTLEDNLGRPNAEIRSLLSKLEGTRSHERLRNNTFCYLQKLLEKEGFPGARYQYLGAAEDKLYEPTYRHKHHSLSACMICTKCKNKEDKVCGVALESLCSELKCDENKLVRRQRLSGSTVGTVAEEQKPCIHFGLIASGDTVMKSGEDRDKVVTREKVIGFEMEGAGVWDNFPCVVIKGVCDYADSHKNKKWQDNAAAAAAACMKAFLKEWVSTDSPPQPSPTTQAHRTTYGSLQASNLLTDTSFSGSGGITFGGVQPSASQVVEIRMAEEATTSINTSQEEQDCLTALFLTNPLDDRKGLTNEKGSRVDDTCEWIKTNGLYKSWLHSCSQLLWIFGGPGKGKTMLSIFLAEELERSAKTSQDTLFVQYFCDNKDEKRNTAVAIVRGLIYQLLSQRPTLFRHILPSFRTPKKSLFANSSFETLWRIFETMVHDPILGTTNCVLDGLDECDKASLEVLVRKLEALFSTKFKKTSICHLNLIIVSRKLPSFVLGTLSSAPCIQLDADAANEVNHDIRRFIQVKVNELSLHQHYPEQLREHVKNIFSRRAAGTFLWVGIVVNELRDSTSSEVEKVLEFFPPGLEGLYDRMLLQINHQRREIAAKILRWVVMAVRPLTLTELSAAIETPARHSLGLGYAEAIRDRVSYCGYFLTVKNNEVRLIHQSAKEYLLRKSPDPDPQLEYFRIKEQQANLEIARKCINYLQNGASATVKFSQEATHGQLKNVSRASAFPLFSYAAIYWPEHTRYLPSSVNLFDLSLPFYKEQSPVRESWLKTFWATREHGDLPESFSLLHFASYFGIVSLAENLLSKKSLKYRLIFHSLGNKGDSPVNKMDGNGQTALYWAAKGGHPAVIQLLLENGADIEAKNSKGWTPLHSATERGDEAIVNLLLEKGANVKAKDESEWMALHSAARGGHRAIVRLLLSTNNEDINAEDKEGNTALHEAAGNGHNAVIQLLLENSANIEAKSSAKCTPLHSAAERGSEASVRLLLQNGADVNAKTSNGWTALHLSARRGHVAVAQLLFKFGAFIEQRDESGATELHLAAGSGSIAVVKVLLEKHVDIEAEDKSRATATHWAARGGHGKVVRLMLEENTDIEAKNSNGWTALHSASWSGHEAVIRLLIDSGADIEAKNSNGCTALHFSAVKGHQTIVQLLLDKGADIEAKSSDGSTALCLVARSGNEAIVWLLLAKRADVEATDGSGKTALDWAVKFEHNDVVELLQDKEQMSQRRTRGGNTTSVRSSGRGRYAQWHSSKKVDNNTFRRCFLQEKHGGDGILLTR